MKRKTDDPEKPKKRRKVRCVIGRPGGRPDRTPWWPGDESASPWFLRKPKTISGTTPEDR